MGRSRDVKLPSRLVAGPYTSIATNGARVHASQPLTTEQTDLVVGLILNAGHNLSDVMAITFAGEGPPMFDLWPAA